MGVCLAIHFLMLRGTELKFGIGVGVGPSVVRVYFKRDSIKGQWSS